MSGAGWAAAGSTIGYGFGKYLIEKPLNSILNPVWKSYEWTDIGMGMSKPLIFDARPGLWGTISGSSTTEGIVQGAPELKKHLATEGEKK